MKTFKRLLVKAAGLSLAVFSSGGAMAATECNGTISATVTGGVVVNAGDICTLAGANVDGGVRVNEGGILIVCGSIIYGGVKTDSAGNVLIGPEEIPGCTGATIYGAVRISNSGTGVIPGPPSISVENSIIEGGLHLIGNSGPMGIANNNINGGLFCKDNKLNPFDEGKPSFVTGPTTCTFAP